MLELLAAVSVGGLLLMMVSVSLSVASTKTALKSLEVAELSALQPWLERLAHEKAVGTAGGFSAQSGGSATQGVDELR
ncbi:MAG: hypothetical protein LR015_09570 [Verrucomicrobia bacterium]|nr:hypothetical protein [Verrucomicrobiota bacterium]